MELDNEDDVWNEALVEMTEPDGNDADDSGPAPPETIEMHNIHVDDGWGCPSDHPATATTEQFSVVLGVRDDGWGVLAPFIACLYFRCRMGLDRHIVGIIMWFYNTYDDG